MWKHHNTIIASVTESNVSKYEFVKERICYSDWPELYC